MLQITIKNPWQTKRYTHEAGTLSLGREPSSRPAILSSTMNACRGASCSWSKSRPPVSDSKMSAQSAGVSGRQEDLGRANEPRSICPRSCLSARPSSRSLRPRKSRRRPPATDPRRSLLDYRTTSFPATTRKARRRGRRLSSLGQVPSPETLATWFETLLSVQRSAWARRLFTKRRRGRSWTWWGWIEASCCCASKRAGKSPRLTHRHRAEPQYSHSLLDRVLQEGRTLYGNPTAMSIRISLANLEAVVASPIFNATGQIVGAVTVRGTAYPRLLEPGFSRWKRRWCSCWPARSRLA